MGLDIGDIPDLKRIGELALQHDFQFCIHAIGDRANREVLNIYQQVFEAHPDKKDLRWRIEHAQHLSAADIPRFTLIHQHSPSPLNPFGVKGVGEGGPIAPPVVIANAVSDALRPFKAEFNRTPVTPQAIDAAVRAASRAR